MDSTNSICRQIEESLDAFHDGELTASEQVFIEEHLKDCSACIKKLAAIQQLVHSLKAMPRLQVSGNLSSKLDQIVDRPNNVMALRPKVWIPVAAAAAVLAIAFGIHSTMPGTADSAPTVAQSPELKTPRANDSATNVATIQATEPRQFAQQVPVITPGSNSKILAQVNGPGDRAEEIMRQHEQAVKQNATTTIADQAAKHNTVASAVTAVPVPAAVKTSYEIDNEQIAELPTTSNSFTDAVGFATDEDGLYDIKM